MSLGDFPGKVLDHAESLAEAKLNLAFRLTELNVKQNDLKDQKKILTLFFMHYSALKDIELQDLSDKKNIDKGKSLFKLVTSHVVSRMGIILGLIWGFLGIILGFYIKTIFFK
jgi:hypothetical protein